MIILWELQQTRISDWLSMSSEEMAEIKKTNRENKWQYKYVVANSYYCDFHLIKFTNVNPSSQARI